MSFDEVRAVGREVWWLQSRPDQGGRVSLMRADDQGTCEVTPGTADVGSSVHGYGGGVYAVDGKRVWYTDATDRHIHLIVRGAEDRPAWSLAAGEGAYADLAGDGGRLLCVRETGAGDELVEVDAISGSVRVLLHTEGFLAAPRAAGARLAWLTWPADQMPWDGSELWVAPYGPSGLGPARLIAGGRFEAVMQPCWEPDGSLLFLSDRGGWVNLYRWDGDGDRTVVATPSELGPAPWELGYASYVPMADGRVVVTEQDGPRHRLGVVGSNGLLRPVESPYTSIKPYLAAGSAEVYAVASSPLTAPQVVAISVDRPGVPRVIARGPDVLEPGQQLSVPQQLQVKARGNVPVTVLVYPPIGAPRDWCAPLVVRAHPGPTSSMSVRLDWHVQFLTSHGIAVADVDYRGSTGYGRAFRQSLYGRWGIADVEDCVAAAEELLALGRTKHGQVFITGASAGGYTALQAVSRTHVFDGAVARSAITDPMRWQEAAPRWQRPHAYQLLSEAGRVTAEAIRRPVLLIHGASDHVAPVDDVSELARGLSAVGMPHELIILGGAGHELSAKDEIARALDAELGFYKSRLRA